MFRRSFQSWVIFHFFTQGKSTQKGAANEQQWRSWENKRILHAKLTRNHMLVVTNTQLIAENEHVEVAQFWTYAQSNTFWVKIGDLGNISRSPTTCSENKNVSGFFSSLKQHQQNVWHPLFLSVGTWFALTTLPPSWASAIFQNHDFNSRSGPTRIIQNNTSKGRTIPQTPRYSAFKCDRTFQKRTCVRCIPFDWIQCSH